MLLSINRVLDAHWGNIQSAQRPLRAEQTLRRPYFIKCLYMTFSLR
jgi:hypothetical protein